jgi:YggT family protein
MNWLSSIMGVLSAVLQVYMLVLVIRIVLTWVSMDRSLALVRVLGSVTDPYLNWFRRFKFLRWGNFDFSPVAALIVVNFAASLTKMIGVYGEVTLGIVLAIIVQLVWGAASFFFAILGIASLVRLLAVRFRWGGAALWSYADALLQPPAYGLGRLLRPKAFMSYTTSLAILAVANIAAWILGRFLIDLLANLLVKLPV